MLRKTLIATLLATTGLAVGATSYEDDIEPLPSKFDPRLQRLARQAALDPDDGIAL